MPPNGGDALDCDRSSGGFANTTEVAICRSGTVQ